MLSIYYLLRADGTISDIAPYPDKPEDRTDGVWVQGIPDSSLSIYIPKTSVDQLKELYRSLTVDQRAAFSTTKTSVLSALVDDNDTELALYLINNLTIPTELEPIRTQMVTIIQNYTG
jgi:hypothetical protein